MPATKAEKRAIAKYQKANIHQVKFGINKATEPDLLAWLESKENKQGYLKALIRADMAKHQR